MAFPLLRMHLAVLMSAALVPSLLIADDSTKDDTAQAAAPADGKTGEPVEVEVWAIDINSADASSADGPEKRDSDIPKFKSRSDVESWIDAMREQGHTVRSRSTRVTTTTGQATKIHFGTDGATVTAVSISAQGQTNSMVMRPVGTIINVAPTLADDNQIVLAMLWERSELRESDRLLLKPTEGKPIAAMDVHTRSVSSTFVVDGNTKTPVCHDIDSRSRETLLILASARRLQKE